MISMELEQKNQLKAIISQKISETKESIVKYEELTKPIAPDNAIGRLTRMEAIGAKSIDESILRNFKQTLSMLESAAQLIKYEDYGYCVDCDEPIPFKRLQIFPHSRLCVKCKNIKG
jgi:RNA polymerase-binding transcription factor